MLTKRWNLQYYKKIMIINWRAEQSRLVISCVIIPWLVVPSAEQRLQQSKKKLARNTTKGVVSQMLGTVHTYGEVLATLRWIMETVIRTRTKQSRAKQRIAWLATTNRKNKLLRNYITTRRHDDWARTWGGATADTLWACQEGGGRDYNSTSCQTANCDHSLTNPYRTV